jgi:hypothetical protein
MLSFLTAFYGFASSLFLDANQYNGDTFKVIDRTFTLLHVA